MLVGTLRETYSLTSPCQEGKIPKNTSSSSWEGEPPTEVLTFFLPIVTNFIFKHRIGCGVTIMLASPLMILPCRDSLLEVVDVWFHHSHHSNSNSSTNEEQYCWRVLHRLNNRYEKVEDAVLTTEDEVNEIQPEEIDGETRPRTRSRGNSIIVREEPIQHDYIFRNAVMHYGSTLLICSGCYFAAVAVSGVAVVWSFIGSSMAFFIAFILPCSSFIIIERSVPNEDRKLLWLRLAWVILVFSILGALICTSNSLGLFGH